MTEREYFEDLSRRFRMTIAIEVDGPGAPKKLVEKAVERKKKSERDARRDNDDSLLFDEVWCVFDIDDHVKVADAKQQAAAHMIKLAISNPCFELWALLHFQSQTAHIARNKLSSLLRVHVSGYKKRLPLDALYDRYADALRRATALEREHQRHGESGKNPSTGVHRLVECIRGASPFYRT